MFPTTSSKALECVGPSSPQCFRRNKEMSVYNCEWHMNTKEKNVTYDLHIWRNKLNHKVFRRLLNTSIEINTEDLIRYSPVVIWLEAHTGNSVCTSKNTSVTLNETVKLKAPENISVAWFQNHLNLTWKASENDLALAEVWFLNETKLWEKLNTTEITHNKTAYQFAVENLQKNTAYQVKLRHKTTGCHNPLWSDWSPLVIVPAKLEDKLEVTMTNNTSEGARKVKLTWKPVHHAAAVPEVKYTVRDTQSSGGCPCMKKKAFSTNRTEYTGYVSYSPANLSVIARNAAGSSPPAIVTIVSAEPVHNLKPCNKTLLDEELDKANCLEWYKLQDGEPKLVARKTKRDRKSFKNSIKDYVGYIYFEHLCVNERPKTVQMCFYYQKENVPKIAPPDFFASSEKEGSVTLSWKAIPQEDRQGVITHFNLCSVQLNSKDEHHQCHRIPASLVEYQLDNLGPGRKYNITVAGVTSMGEGPKAIVIFNTMNPKKGWWKLGLVIVFLFIFLIGSMCIWKRMKQKILPPVPKTPTLDFDCHQKFPWDMLKVEEERVHDVMLLQLNPNGCTQSEDVKDATMSIDTPTEGTVLSDDDAIRPLKGSKEVETPNMEQEDMLGLLPYRKGLVFEMKMDEF
ncbi:interleukin-6 receptor subunit beta [Corythoichthys intestinalis]|uniref:interleukin-6 receptor subunit beta n=1 Tax=Corythoichthys intestinalis TaxID=161448 RepID=UPI0025A5E1B6|nr:interleukin-6 receptor subunit beta [Corythoichthys intestinalis]